MGATPWRFESSLPHHVWLLGDLTVINKLVCYVAHYIMSITRYLIRTLIPIKVAVFLLLKFAIHDFKEDREYKNISARTLGTYMLTLKEFRTYCTEREIINVEDISAGTIKSYLIHCQQERGNNPTTRNSKLHNLKIFFNYLEDSDILTEKQVPTKKMAYVKEEINIEAFTDEHIKKMLSYLRRVKQRDRAYPSYRDYTIIITILGTGARLGELINLRWNDVDIDNGVITVNGKKREKSSIPITGKLAQELMEYLAFCRMHFDTLSEFVFVSDRKNGKLSNDGMKSIFQRLQHAMCFTDVRLSAHTFRHTFAHRMLMNGCDVFTLQKMLRHSQIAMTQRYVSIWGTALREQNDKFNPLNNIEV